MCASVAVIAAAALCLVIAVRQMTHTQMLIEPRVRLERYLSGYVDRPFAFRVLVPTVVRAGVAIAHALERQVAGVDFESFGQPLCRKLEERGVDVSGGCTPYLVLAGTLWLSLVLFSIAMFLAFRALFPSSGLYATAAPVVALLSVSAIQSLGAGHLYDCTVLAIMAWGTYLILTGRRRWFFVLFTLGCLNKETTVVLGVAYVAVALLTRPRRPVAAEASMLAGIFGLTYLGAHWLFADNPGAGAEFWWKHHIRWVLGWTPAEWGHLLAALGILGFGWRGQPVALRRCALMIHPHLALCAIGAYPGELRTLYEILPVLTLILARNLQVGWSALAEWRPGATRRGDEAPTR